MNFKFEKSIDYFVFFIILIKIVFIISALGHLILSHYSTSISTSAIYNNKASQLDPKLVYWKERTEFIFIISMSLLLIYYFNPRFTKKPINDETALLFFLFGWILIFTANWSLFVTEAPWYKQFVNALS